MLEEGADAAKVEEGINIHVRNQNKSCLGIQKLINFTAVMVDARVCLVHHLNVLIQPFPCLLRSKEHSLYTKVFSIINIEEIKPSPIDSPEKMTP